MTRTDRYGDIKRLMNRTTTVGDLIAELQAYNENDVVVFACDYGDYSHTKQALAIVAVQGLTEEMQELVPSAYSHSRVAIQSTEDEGDDSDDRTAEINRFDVSDGPRVVVLRSSHN